MADSHSDAPMHPRDRGFWVWITLFGTVFGYGVYALIAGEYWWGGILTPLGLAGLLALLTYRPPIRRETINISLLIGALALTWAAIGYQLWEFHYRAPRSSEISSLISQKSTLVEWLQKAHHERDKAVAERNLAQNSSAASSGPTFATDIQIGKSRPDIPVSLVGRAAVTADRLRFFVHTVMMAPPDPGKEWQYSGPVKIGEMHDVFQGQQFEFPLITRTPGIGVGYSLDIPHPGTPYPLLLDIYIIGPNNIEQHQREVILLKGDRISDDMFQILHPLTWKWVVAWMSGQKRVP
jgi:hypothetical protein